MNEQLTSARDPPPGWVTITDLARERGVDKSAISRRVARLEKFGLLRTQTLGKAKLVERAEFERAAAQTVDAVREANGRGGTGPLDLGADVVAGDPVLAREQARKAHIDAQLKQLDLDERLGRLVEIESVRLNVASIAVELGRALDALPGRADALAAAVTKDGVAGLRIALRSMAREMRETLARAAELFGDGDDATEAETSEAPAPEAVA